MPNKLYPEKPILIVDDEEFWLVSLQMLLAKRGKISHVLTCSDSSQVMSMLAEQEFSLVLLDYLMPEVSGDELLKQIVPLYPQLPVAIITGNDQEEMAEYCMALGACNYFVKTLEGENLTVAIREILQLQENKRN